MLNDPSTVLVKETLMQRHIRSPGAAFRRNSFSYTAAAARSVSESEGGPGLRPPSRAVSPALHQRTSSTSSFLQIQTSLSSTGLGQGPPVSPGTALSPGQAALASERSFGGRVGATPRERRRSMDPELNGFMKQTPMVKLMRSPGAESRRSTFKCAHHLRPLAPAVHAARVSVASASTAAVDSDA